MTSNTLAHFNGQSLSIIDHAGRKWLTAVDAGRALGYGHERASTSINTLYSRHADEFTEADSVDIKLVSTDGKTYMKRIFSETGCNKLGFFANTAVAKQFRQFAAQTLAGQAPDADLLAQLAAMTEALGAYQRAEFEANPRWLAIADMRAAGRGNRQIAAGLGVKLRTLEREVMRINSSGLGRFLPESVVPPVGHKALAQHPAQMSLEV